MTALAANVKLQVRGGPNFGYGVAAGLHVFAGAFLALNAAGVLVRPQDAGAVVFAGVADRELDNSLGVTATAPGMAGGGFVVAQRFIVIKAAVPAATYANIGAPVYAVDDGTLTLTQSGALLQVGTLEGFDNGTWIRIAN
jgi:hypothetical protein